MNDKRDTESSAPGLNADHACDTCGCFGAVQIGDRWLCVDCYEGCGSCCQEWLPNDVDSGPEPDAS